MNLQTELEHYRWKLGRDGVWTQEPIDDWNHVIDAARYWGIQELERASTAERMLSRRGKKLSGLAKMRSRGR